MNIKGMNRDIIKYIAVIAMTFNHIAHVFLAPGTILYEVFIDIGYFTAVTMCYFLVEGYHYTQSKKRYGKRLLIFAFIAQIPYGLVAKRISLNMLFTLFICFLILWVMENVKENSKRKMAVLSLSMVTFYCDWAVIAAIFTILFEISRGDKKLERRAYMRATILYGGISFLSFITQYTLGAAILYTLFSSIGIIVSGIVILGFYNGKKAETNQRFNKWFFYIYYPAHLIVLLLIKALS